MKLWLLRHGQAFAQAAHDSERELTPLGQAQIRQSAQQLMDVPLDLILTSPYVRAQQTTEQVLAVLKRQIPQQTVAWATPDDSAKAALKYLDQYAEQNILLVTHQFFVGQLAGLLVDQPPLALHTGTLLELEGEFIAAGLMQLKHAYHPQQE